MYYLSTAASVLWPQGHSQEDNIAQGEVDNRMTTTPTWNISHI